MAQLIIRKATVDDAEELSELLNEIIEAGGTTALEDLSSPELLADWFISGEFPSHAMWRKWNSGLPAFSSSAVTATCPRVGLISEPSRA